MIHDVFNLSPGSIAWTASWIATGVGLAMWLWSWFGEKNAIQKLRWRDCGVVMLFGGILTRVAVQDRPMMSVDWAMVLLGPLFIGAALWRLGRTATAPAGRV